jgi:hypothetical protein
MDNISTPKIYKDKWLMFENTVVKPLELTDCNDTISGICLADLTMNECTEKFRGDSDMGYYVKINNKSICVPIRSAVNARINPSYRLKNQDIYKFPKNVKFTYFQNKEVYPYPPLHSAQVFYNNIININSYDDKNFGFTADVTKNNSRVYLNDKNNLNLIILPKITTNNALVSYKPIYYGDYITIHVPNTTLILRQDENNILRFIIRSFENILDENSFFNSNITFYLDSDDKTKKGKPVNWQDPIIIRSEGNNIVKINENNQLIIVRDDKKLSEKEKYFRLDTKQDGYYCENNNCKKINYDKAIKVKDSESLKIKKQDNTLTDFYFKDDCWGTCNSKNNNAFFKYQESNKNNVPIFFYIFLGIISILIFILIIKRRSN